MAIRADQASASSPAAARVRSGKACTIPASGPWLADPIEQRGNRRGGSQVHSPPLRPKARRVDADHRMPERSQVGRDGPRDSSAIVGHQHQATGGQLSRRSRQRRFNLSRAPAGVPIDHSMRNGSLRRLADHGSHSMPGAWFFSPLDAASQHWRRMPRIPMSSAPPASTPMPLTPSLRIRLVGRQSRRECGPERARPSSRSQSPSPAGAASSRRLPKISTRLIESMPRSASRSRSSRSISAGYPVRSCTMQTACRQDHRG